MVKDIQEEIEFLLDKITHLQTKLIKIINKIIELECEGELFKKYLFNFIEIISDMKKQISFILALYIKIYY